MVLNKFKSDPFAIIRSLPDNVRPDMDLITYAESRYLMFRPEPDYVSAFDFKIMFEWYYPNMKNPTRLDQLVFHEPGYMTWEPRVFDTNNV